MKTKKQKKRSPALSCGGLVRRLRALEKHWAREAAAFHRMGREEYRRGNMAGKEYMQTAAAFRACASELKQARSPNTKPSGALGVRSGDGSA